jgi:hypothetical protein
MMKSKSEKRKRKSWCDFAPFTSGLLEGRGTPRGTGGSSKDNFENGQISLEEFKLALVDCEHAEEEAEKMFAALDLDGTGSIHHSEFLGDCVAFVERIC